MQVFGQDGSFKSSFGSFGLDGAHLNGPTGLAAIEDEVYVVDTGNSRVQVYPLDGACLRSLGGINTLLYSFDVEVATDGTVFVSNPTTFEGVTFGPAGAPTGRLTITQGGSPASPQSLSLDAQEQLFIAV